jgi:hypothetical protein
MSERTQRFAMLPTLVIRTWLDGENPDLARTVSALDRAGAWSAPPRLPRPRVTALWPVSFRRRPQRRCHTDEDTARGIDQPADSRAGCLQTRDGNAQTCGLPTFPVRPLSVVLSRRIWATGSRCAPRASPERSDGHCFRKYQPPRADGHPGQSWSLRRGKTTRLPPSSSSVCRPGACRYDRSSPANRAAGNRAA